MLTFWIFELIKYLGKVLSYLKNGGIGVNYCCNYGPLKLLLYFIEYRLDQLNNKHTKTTVNSTIQFFESPNQKRNMVKFVSLKFFGPSTTKWRSYKIFAKLNGNHLLMTNIFKLHKYQTFGLLKMYNMSKIWFANNKFSLWKSLVYDNGPSKM